MKNLKIKLFLFLVALLFGAAACVFLSSIIHFQFQHIKLTPDSLKLLNCIHSIVSDRRHLMLFLCLCGVVLLLSVLIAVSNIGGKYESDMRQITPDIKTPVAAGQSQHGSARWLEKIKLKKVFAIVNTGWKNPRIKELMRCGYDTVTDKNNPQPVKKRQKRPAKGNPKKLSAAAKAKKAAANRKAASKKHRDNKPQAPKSEKKPISIVSKGWDGAGNGAKRKK
ncbi:MAG: hypothetical protein LBQ48_05070 [Oscillospiraceae bacterium]|jgi:type IV secretion system protein VirD4|nr:hypothetical protein [Oscillospiraceae bacterium]